MDSTRVGSALPETEFAVAEVAGSFAVPIGQSPEELSDTAPAEQPDEVIAAVQPTATVSNLTNAHILERLAALEEAHDIVALHLGPETDIALKLAVVVHSVQEGIQLGVNNQELAEEIAAAAPFLTGITCPPHRQHGWSGSRFRAEVLPTLTDMVGLHRVVNEVAVTGYNTNSEFFAANAEDLAEMRSSWMAQAQQALAQPWHEPLKSAVASAEQLETLLVAKLDQVSILARPPLWHRIVKIAAVGLVFAAVMLMAIAVIQPSLITPGPEWLLTHVVLELVLGAGALGIWMAVAQDRAKSRRAARIDADARAALRSAVAAGVEVPITNLFAAQQRLGYLARIIAG